MKHEAVSKKEDGTSAEPGIEIALVWKNGSAVSSKTVLDSTLASNEVLSPLSLEMADHEGDSLPCLLQSMVVTVERAIERVPVESLAFPCPKCHEYFDFEDGLDEAEATLDKCGCECTALPKVVEKRDSCIQTSPMFEIVGTIPHIDSDEEDDGGDEKDGRSSPQESKESSRSVTTGPVSTGTMTRKSRELVQPKSIEEVAAKAVMSGIHLPGTHDAAGRPVITIDGPAVLADGLARHDVAKVLLFYATVPDRAELDKGFCILLLLGPCDGPEAQADDNRIFDLLDQAFNLVKKFIRVNAVLVRRLSSSKATAIYQQRWQRAVAFPKTNIQHHFVTDDTSLRAFLSVADAPQAWGGKAAHDQLEWVEFYKELEPFLTLCHASGRRLVSVMADLRVTEQTLSRRQIHHQQRAVTRTLTDSDLQKLRKDGTAVLSQLEDRAQWLPSSQHVQASLAQAKRLFAEVDRAAKRLEQLLEKRRQRLRELVRIRALEDESTQVLSWLMKKGEDTLKKHADLATSLQGIKKQEQEFEKFYFISMRHLDKGSDLVDEAGQCAGDEMPLGSNCSGLRDLAKSLKHHLRGFGERLEDTRERLEDTSRCFYLLDKAYEWSLETSKYVNRLKPEEAASEETARQMLNNIQQRLTSNPPLSESHFNEMATLSKKLDNEKLMDQCRLAQARYQEAEEAVQTVQTRLLQAQRLGEEDERPGSPTSTSTPNYNVGRRRSLGAFPYIYKCSHHAAGHECACDPMVTRDPSKTVARQCQCACATLPKPLSDIRESAEDLLEEKCEEWECGGSRAALKRHLRRTCTWQYPAEGFDSFDQDNTSNKSSNSGESDHKDLEDGPPVTPVPVPMSVNSHLYCHASNLSLNSTGQGEQVKDAKTQKNILLIMREMIQTEKDYVASLEYVIENYIPQLLREDIPQALRGQRNVVFGNIEKIYEFHSQHFLQELDKCEKKPLSVGQCFLRHEKKFYLYALYNKNKPKSDSLLMEYGSSFFKSKQLELGDKMDLASYLLKPVQRMGKYALLLQQLMKAVGEKEPSELSSAEAMVRFQLRHGNDLLAMDSLRDCDVNLKEQGRLLRQNEFLVWQGKGKKCLRQVFLFEELILFSKARRFPDRKNLDLYIYKNSIKTTDIGLTAKIGDSPTKFEIWFRKRKPNDTFTLQSMSEEVKQAWAEELSALLWKQALKNREVRLQEMSSMGIGNKPCLDIRPSADQISDRSISMAQLSKSKTECSGLDGRPVTSDWVLFSAAVPRFRNSIAVLSREFLGSNKRPHSIISVTSSSSSGGSTGSGSHAADSPRLPRSALHSQCSTESGIIADMSLASEDLEGRGGRWHLERSNSSATSVSLDSSLSPTSSADDASGFASKLYDQEATTEI